MNILSQSTFRAYSGKGGTIGRNYNYISCSS